MSLSENQRAMVDRLRLGFVATVAADGTPNLSPKGTFLALDAERVMFGEMRSPNTMRNLRAGSRVAVNFVDQFSRRGLRLDGEARIVERGAAEFEALFPRFLGVWGAELCALFNAIIVIRVTRAAPLASPVYELGAEEATLRREWLERHTREQEGLIGE